MKITKKVQASNDIMLTGNIVFRIWQGKLRIGEIIYRDKSADLPQCASVAVAWDDGSHTTTKANFLRYIDPGADMSKIQELQILFNEYGVDISNEVKLREYYLAQTGDEDLSDDLSDEAAYYGRQLTTQSWQNVKASTVTKSIQYNDFVIALDLGGDGYNIYKDGELWDEGYASIQKAMQAIDEDTQDIIQAGIHNPYEGPYGVEDVKALLSGSGDSDWWYLKEIEMDFGDGEKLVSYAKSLGKPVMYDEDNEHWYVPKEYSWTDCYFYPYPYGHESRDHILAAMQSAPDSDNWSAEDDDNLPTSQQEFTSEKTSINSTKLPAVYKLITIPAGQVGIDYGGGKFDNAVDYMAEQDVTLVVYDPYNRTPEHNKAAIKTIRSNGGADFAICSNVLNVIKEANVRAEVLQNIKKLLKPSGKLYLTVYEGRADGAEGETKSGYQLNRPTSSYLDEVREVFPDAVRKGKLITATPSGSPVQAATDINAGDLTDDQFELLLHLRQKAHEVLLSPSFGFLEEDVNDYYFVEGKMIDDAFVVEVRAELDYDSMMELAEALNPLVAAVDSGAYFDMEEPGIMTAYLYQDSITSAQNVWDIPEKSLEPREQSDFRYDMEEAIDFDFDLTLTVDDTGYYEYSEESKEDFIGDGPKGEWYGEEYNGTLVTRPEDLEEQLYELIHHMIPEKAGRYRIQGTAHLVYEIEGVSPETEEEVPFNTGDVSFCYEKSSVDNFNWQVVDDSTVQSATVVEPVKRVRNEPLSHGYFLKEYSTGVKQITKPRPYDDAEYWWARYDEARKSWGICKSSMCRKYISEDDIDSLDDVVEELEMLNSIISPKMIHN